MTSAKLPAAVPALVILSGYPGAGKTTFARALVESTGCLHVESDAIRRRLFARPTYAPAESARVFAAAESMVEAGLAGNRHVVLDATNLAVRDRRRFVRLAARLDATIVPVRLVATDATIRERLSKARDGFSEATPAVYEAMLGRARGFAVPALVVDSRFGFEPALALVRALMERGSEC
ncbi:MAG: ATP-binding protein [Chloroflexi bacterium]|nr:ATP-binding protein [Chloroflexota bacterium]